MLRRLVEKFREEDKKMVEEARRRAPSMAAETENLVDVFNELTTPLQYSEISIPAVGSGLVVTTVGVGGQIYFCAQIGPACTALLPATGTVTAGGIFLINFGVDFTQQQTIPAWKRLFGIGQ